MVYIPVSIKRTPIFIELSFYDLPNELREHTENDLRTRDYKLESDMRAKRVLIDYALCNDWDYFYTITLDETKVGDRTDVDRLVKKLRQYFKNFKVRTDNDLKYILIIEPHYKLEDNGKYAIHFHGLIKLNEAHKDNNPLGFPVDEFNNYILDHYYDKHGNKVMYMESPKIKKSFGINTFTAIYNSNEFLSYYISKYITKMDLKNIKTSQRYYKSKGLSVPVRDTYSHHSLFAKKFIDLGLAPSYQNKFVVKYKFTEQEFKELENQLGEKIELW